MAQNDKKKFPSRLLWLDLEMTGLDPEQDLILELACEVTDFNFTTLDTYEACVRQPKQAVVRRMNKNIWWKEFPHNRDHFLDNLDNGKSLATVEKEMLELVNKHFNHEPAVLAGNSIYNDRLFIKQWLPALELKLHYRMLDVSSLKIYMQGKFAKEFKKPGAHRAFEDIQGSIAEWQYYVDWLSKRHDT